MPPLPAVHDVIRIQLNVGTDASIEAGSRFFVSYTGGTPNTTDLNDLATAVKDAYSTHLAGLLNNAQSLHGVICTDMASSTGAVGVWEGTVNGTRPGVLLTASTSCVVNHQISRRYRGGKPKTFMVFGSEADLNGTNQWSGAFQTEALGDWESFIAEVLATSGMSVTLANIVNVSYYEGFTTFTTPSGRVKNLSTLRTTPLVDPIVSSTIAPKLGSQRRRLNI